jgi:hypothetical protein
MVPYSTIWVRGNAFQEMAATEESIGTMGNAINHEQAGKKKTVAETPFRQGQSVFEQEICRIFDLRVIRSGRCQFRLIAGALSDELGAIAGCAAR